MPESRPQPSEPLPSYTVAVGAIVGMAVVTFGILWVMVNVIAQAFIALHGPGGLP